MTAGTGWHCSVALHLSLRQNSFILKVNIHKTQRQSKNQCFSFAHVAAEDTLLQSRYDKIKNTAWRVFYVSNTVI